MKNAKLRIVSVLAVLGLLPQYGVISAFAAEDTNTASYACGNLNIDYQVVGEWEHHQNIQLSISNPTEEPVYLWAFRFQAGGTIQNPWNAAVLESNETEYVLSNLSYNNVIQPNSTSEIGYTLEFDEDAAQPAEFINCVETVTSDSGYTLDCVQDESWEDGSSGTVSITNNTDAPMYGWELRFESDCALDYFWNAELVSAEENTYVLHCTDYNSIIEPGASVSFSYLSGSADEAAISNASLTYQTIGTGQIIIPEPIESDFELSGFSEYGLNILKWNCDLDADYRIFRAEDGDFEELASVSKSQYYIDEEVEENTEYQYYVIAGEDADAPQSNTISVTSGEAPAEEPTDLPAWYEAMMNLEEDYAELHIGYNGTDHKDYVSQNLTLADTGAYGSQIRWTSSEPLVILESGEVNAPFGDAFTPVTLTAKLTNGEYSMLKTFTVQVAPRVQNIPAEVPALELDDLVAMNHGTMPEILYNGRTFALETLNGNCSAGPVRNAGEAYNVLASLRNFLRMETPAEEIGFVGFTAGSADEIYSFRQMYQGLPVYGYVMQVHVDPETKIANHVFSLYQPQLALETEPAVSAEEIAAILSETYGASEFSEPVLAVYYPNPNMENTEPKLAWIIDETDTVVSGVILDAVSGEIMKANAPVSDTSYLYGEDNDLLGRYVAVGALEKGPFLKTSYLYDKRRNIKMYDASSENHDTWGNWKEYKRSDRDWSDAKYDDAVAAEYNVEKTYDYFDNTHSWGGFDGSGGDTRMKIGVNYAHEANAYSSAESLKFGAEDLTNSGTRAYCADIDTVGHEFTHSVTHEKFKQVTGDRLPYEGESGAIDEAYSDIFGEFVDPDYNWIHGDKIRDAAQCTTLGINPWGRYIMDPTKDQNPKIYEGKYWEDPKNLSSDNGGVHTNQSVLTYAAYLMTQDDSLSGLPGIAKEDLEQIWFKSYDFYFTSKPSFDDCRLAVSAAALSYSGGVNNDIFKKVVNCFQQVNLAPHTVTIQVTNNYDDTPLRDVRVKLTAPDGTTTDTLKTDMNGEVRFNGIMRGDYTVDLSCAGYVSVNKVVFMNPNLPTHTFKMETLPNKTLQGTITIADTDSDVTNNAPLADATLKLRNKTTYKTTGPVTTDANGKYKFTGIPAGEYELTISKTGYITTTQLLRVTRSVEYNFMIELIPETFAGEGYASGTITDAVNGSKVPGLTLKIYKGLFVGVSEPTTGLLGTMTTDTSGNYRTEALDAGEYTIFIIDNRPGLPSEARYLKTSFAVKILGDHVIANQNASVSRTLNQGQIRIVLKWGSSPRDLDSHMYIRTQTGARVGHTWYSSFSANVSGTRVAALDWDCRIGNGPETTTIYAPEDYSYSFYVHDFTNGNLGASNTNLAASGAMVYIYSGNSAVPMEVFSVPAGNGTVWNVFSYNAATSRLTIHNTLGTYLPS